MMSASERNVSDDDISGRPPTHPLLPVDLQWLDKQRALRGWVRKGDLARALGITAATISDLYSRGATSPATFEKLRRALAETPTDELAAALLGEAAEGAA